MSLGKIGFWSKMVILEVEIEGFEITFLDYGSFLKLACQEEFVSRAMIRAPQ